MKLIAKISYDVGDSTVADYKLSKIKLKKALEDAGFCVIEEYSWKDIIVEK